MCPFRTPRSAFQSLAQCKSVGALVADSKVVHQPPLIVEFPARCCIVRLPLALDLKHFRSFRAARGEARKKTKDPKKKGKRKIVRVSPSFYLQKPPAPGGSIFACCWPLFLLLLFRFSVLVAGERKPGKISEIFSRMRHAYQYHAGEGIIHNYIFPLHVKISRSSTRECLSHHASFCADGSICLED